LPLLGKALLSTEPKSFPTQPLFAFCEPKRVVHAQRLSAGELGLALGIINAYARVFGHRLSGLVLAGLIPSAGSMLFQNSDDDDTHEVEAICMTALRNMV
jgi:hypothetical protein